MDPPRGLQVPIVGCGHNCCGLYGLEVSYYSAHFESDSWRGEIMLGERRISASGGRTANQDPSGPCRRVRQSRPAHFSLASMRTSDGTTAIVLFRLPPRAFLDCPISSAGKSASGESAHLRPMLRTHQHPKCRHIKHRRTSAYHPRSRIHTLADHAHDYVPCLERRI